MMIPDDIHIIGVIGSGVMGSGIAQVAAQSGYKVLLYDVDAKLLEKAVASIGGFLRRAADKGKITPEGAESALARITTVLSLDEFKPCDLVIEAAPERLELKESLFRQLSSIVHPEAILATNTSTLGVTQIAAAATQPERVVGMHFFNPAPLMALVEVIAGAETSEAVTGAIVEIASRMGKNPVRVKDTPGFIVNRVARPFYLEALRLLQDGVADPETIDRIVRGGGGFRMGPFELMDLIGIDVNYAASRSVYEQFFHEPRFRPSILQQRMVESGRLGKKSGRGWHTYDSIQ
jgi:3-hydroxybutyryl-CoA dehydrogenase